jgi:hypothetical protein
VLGPSPRLSTILTFSSCARFSTESWLSGCAKAQSIDLPRSLP